MAREAPRILVVDDDPSFRRLLEIWLAERGFEVHEAADGESGLRAAARLEPDAVLLDWRLPDESGVSVCRRLAERVPRPAIVMLTALNDPRDRETARQAGADAFLVKGVEPDALAEAVRGLVRGESRFERDATRPAVARPD